MIKKSLLFATSVSLFLTACNTAPSTQQNQIPVMNTGSSNVSSQVAGDVQAQDNVYRSLVIKPEQSFQTKGVVDSAKRAVVAKIGTVEYTLTYSFMNKLRTLLNLAPYNAAVTNEAVALTGFFTRLKSASGVSTAANATTLEPLYVSAYTLSASETSFVAKLETYSAVVMPNFLPVNDVTADTTVPSTLDSIGTLKFIVNKTGIRNDFYKAVHYAMGQSNNASDSDFNVMGDHVLYYNYINPATTATGFSYTATGNTGLTTRTPGSLLKSFTTSAGGTAIVTSAVEKTYLNSIINAGPHVKDVVLLNEDGTIGTGNIGINFGYADTLTDIAVDGFDLMEWNGIASPNTAYPVTAFDDPASASMGNEDVAMQPAATANLNGAAAVMAASALVDAGSTETQTVGLSSELVGSNWYDFSPPASMDLAAPVTFGDWHQGIRSLHMYAGGATALAAPSTSLAFTGLTAPTAVAAAAVTAPMLTTELAGSKNLFEAAEYMFGATDVHKLVKSTATTNKNQQAIVNFFYETDPTMVASGGWSNTNVTNRALIVPCTRTVSATGVATYTFSAAGTSYVVITAEPTTYPGLDFYMTDPAGKPLKSGLTDNGAYYQLVIDNPVLIGNLYNYTGTLVGVKGTGGTLP